MANRCGCAICDTRNNPWAFLIREEVDEETMMRGGITVWINEDRLCVSADDSRAFNVYGEARINYCPMCGKRIL